MTDQAPLILDRWISTYRYQNRTVAAVFYASTDTTSTELHYSQHHGPLAVLRTQLWALRRYGRLLEVREP